MKQWSVLLTQGHAVSILADDWEIKDGVLHLWDVEDAIRQHASTPILVTAFAAGQWVSFSHVPGNRFSEATRAVSS